MQQTSCQVKFILELNYSSREQKDKLLPLYGSKFVKVLQEAKSRRYLSMDYASLVPIRRLVERVHSLEGLMPYLEGELEEEGLMKLLGIAPLFNMAPVDLKAYILMSLGLRNVRSR